jgi:hypothetical protein
MPKGRKKKHIEFKMKLYKSPVKRTNRHTPFKTHSFKQLIFAPTSSGKTNWAVNVVKNYLKIGYYTLDNIHIFTPNTDDLWKHIPKGYNWYPSLYGYDVDKDLSNIEYVVDLIKDINEEFHEEKARLEFESFLPKRVIPANHLIIVDDCLTEIKNNKNPELEDLTRRNHHYNTSLLIITQQISDRDMPMFIKDGVSSICFLRFIMPKDIETLYQHYMQTGLTKKQLKDLYKKIHHSENNICPLVWLKEGDRYLKAFTEINPAKLLNISPK